MDPGLTLCRRYVLERELGRGNVGVVFAGRDHLLEREVAVKLIDLLDQSSALLEAELQQEAKLAAALEHPGIVPIYDFGRDEELLFLIMPRLHGRTLAELLAHAPLPVPLVAEIGRQLALALGHSHAHGVVHGDVKPANVMLTRDAGQLHVKLMDFGLASVAGRRRRRSRDAMLSSRAYLAPEREHNQPLEPGVDIYALGVVLYEALIGRLPFAVGGSVNGETEPPPLTTLRAELPDELAQLLGELLAERPDQRPREAGLIAARLAPLADADAIGNLLGAASKLPNLVSTPLAIESSDTWMAMLHDAVGRESTLRAIDTRLLAARSGGLQLVLLAGEAGIGKTTLLDELALACQQRGIELLRTSAIREQAGGWRGSFGELLTAGLAQRPEAVDLLADDAASLVEMFPGLAHGRLGRMAHRPRRESSWVGLEDVEARAAVARSRSAAARERELESGESSRERCQAVCVRAFEALVASGRALTLAIDDAHVDGETVELIDVLFRRLVRAPLVFVVAYDPVEVRDSHPLARMRRRLAQHPRALSLTLEPLEQDDYDELLVQLLGAGAGRPEAGLSRSLFVESGGRPLYARELVRVALDSGVLVQRDGIWRLEAARWPIPRSVQATVAGTLRRLPAGVRGVLRIGAVLAVGTGEFDLDELAELGGYIRGELDELLGRAIERGLLSERHEAGRIRLRFGNELLRRIIHAELSPVTRRKLHRHCAERIRRLPFSEVLDASRRDARLAHLLAGQAVAEARSLVIELVTRALDEGRPERARQPLLDLLEYAESMASVELGELLLLHAELEHARGQDHAAISALTRLAVVIEQTDEPRLSRFGERGADLAKRLDHRKLSDRLLGLRPRDRRAAERQRRARAELAALRPATSSRSMQIGDLLLMHGEYTAAREAYDSARRRAAAEADRYEEARQLQKLARVASKLGHYESAIAYCRDGLELLAGKHSLERVGLWAAAAQAHCAAEHYERVEAELEGGVAELATFPAQRSSDRDRVEAELERGRGAWLLARGDAPAAIEAFERAVSLIPSNDRWTLSIVRVNLGQACALAGQSSRALRELERATADQRAIGDRLGLVHAQIGRIQVLHDLGQVKDAGELLVEACELGDEIEDPRLFASVRIEHGRNVLLGGKLELATQEARRARDMARNSGAWGLVGEATELLACVELARGELDDARHHALEAVELAAQHRLGALLVDALLVLAEASAPEQRPELFERARVASEALANPYRELDLSLTSLRLGLGDPLHASDDYVALEQLSDRAEALSAQRHVGLCLLAQAEVLAPHDQRGALDHARLGEAQLRVLGARLEADRASELIARLTLR